MDVWYFIFSETSVFKKRYIKFTGTQRACKDKYRLWHLENMVNSVICETEFIQADYIGRGYKEIKIEKE